MLEELTAFVKDIAGGPHEDICPLAHPAYRNKWCACCEARKLLTKLNLVSPSESAAWAKYDAEQAKAAQGP